MMGRLKNNLLKAIESAEQICEITYRQLDVLRSLNDAHLTTLQNMELMLQQMDAEEASTDRDDLGLGV